MGCVEKLNLLTNNPVGYLKAVIVKKNDEYYGQIGRIKAYDMEKDVVLVQISTDLREYKICDVEIERVLF